MAGRTLLNNVDHMDVRVITRHEPRFGDAVNQALVFPTEFEALQREYPIFFRRDANGALQAVVLLGLDRDENLYLGDGRWQARYVPAIHRRGPFSIALQARPGQAPEPMIHIDLDHPRVSQTEGEALFLPAGGNSPYLQELSRTLGDIYEGLEAGKAMFAIFEEMSLIEPVSVGVRLDETVEYDVPGLHTINAERLDQLAGAQLEALHRAGFLRLAYAVAASLPNMSRLIELKNRKRAARAA
ncbi:SapC family protein [Caulobacter segnis]|uniref:SapC family protein n=1 Tax=Caulobacter segnis TaxID=88688 RepID=UPI00240F4C54|nr:SapC family protein [Caulobacter segnis]MDG2522591.1 SapC family protein [Caulobacter segnis]